LDSGNPLIIAVAFGIAVLIFGSLRRSLEANELMTIFNPEVFTGLGFRILLEITTTF
jgi:hypothetical protein